jgi:hypothetical protein
MQVLYAPMLADDFYLSHIDWSSRNVLSMGLEGMYIFGLPALVKPQCCVIYLEVATL